MSLIPAPSAEDLMQPSFAGGKGAAGEMLALTRAFLPISTRVERGQQILP